ncbi:G protein-coupled glucose receptor regulating Gpa2 [Teratosphaeria destructans]|uniref:G protein-coupled glucose receptor regulating Gpa2 n=1 Tax=Teratosphaeria destructans TaxID=418781 RepID=A0A9W7W4B4_9PEZI|nr:G protein-coupled glucose receptor regulating Gpa2 [Teratosphaeria destructans]
MSLPLWVTVPTFVCSLLSFLADLASAASYFLTPLERHFRQALIFNLLLADLINSGNNTISGAIALARRHKKYPLEPGPACDANAYIGQLTVQAVDFNILVIALAVLLTVKRSSIVERPPRWKVAIVCLIPWTPSLITANIATGLGVWAPAGNWCWIKKNLLLRYSLTHGWRIMIFFITIGIYTYIYLYLKRKYGQLHISSTDRSVTRDEEQGTGTDKFRPDIPLEVRAEHSTPRPSDVTQVELEPRMGAGSGGEFVSSTVTTPKTSCTSHVEVDPQRRPSESQAQLIYPPQTVKPKQRFGQRAPCPLSMQGERQRRKVLRKMLLLNGYPVLYIILWIPGIANRFAEIVLGKPPLWLTAMQASTQLVGFANALTYVWNEQLSDRVKEKLGFRKRRRPSFQDGG